MDNLIMAIFHTIVGMGTVFVVLIIISLVISLFVYVPAAEETIRSLLSRFSKKKKDAGGDEKIPLSAKEKKVEKGDGVSAGNKRSVIQKETEEELLDDKELIAVITVAIAASSGGAVSADKLTVRSVRKVKNKR